MWAPVPGAPVSWKVTPLGLGALEHEDPLARLCELFVEQERYKPIYRQVLALCSIGDGIDAVSVGRAVDDNPLLQEPRMWAPAFLNNLERCGALKWTGKLWATTDLGHTALAQLDRELGA